jgi:hypothetical protein
MLAANIAYLMAHPGVVAVLVVGPVCRTMSGVESWYQTLSDAASMLANTDEEFLNIRLGEHSILAERIGKQLVAVVYPTGHAVAKVIRRMVRHAGKPGPIDTRKSTRGPEFPERRKAAAHGNATC